MDEGGKNNCPLLCLVLFAAKGSSFCSSGCSEITRKSLYKENEVECLDGIFGAYATGCDIGGPVTLNVFTTSFSLVDLRNCCY